VPSRLRRLAELLALCGLIVTEPVLTALRDGADVFVSRRAEPVHIVAVTLVIVLGLPLALFLVEGVVALVAGARAQDRFHRLVLAGLGGLVVIRLLGDAGLPGPLTVVLAVAGAALLGIAVSRWYGVRQWLQLIGVFPLLLGAWFLATEPMRELLLDPSAATGESAEVADPVPIVVVVLDEFPELSILDDDNQIDADQFPNLAQLAGDATWYRNASGVSPTTPEAVPPILTGRYPERVGLLPTAEEHPDNIFTLLRGTYALHVQESVTQLCPTDLCQAGALAVGNPFVELMQDAADLWRRQLFGGEADRQVDFAIRQSDPNAPSTFTRFAREMRTGDRPTLDLIHAVYPHQPWFHLPDGVTYDAPFIAEGLDQYANYSWTSDFAADLGRQRHLLQARNADVMVGLLMNRLRELGTYDDSLIVVTADHGASFRQGEPIRGASADNVDGVLWVPLLIKAPGQTAGGVDDRPARTIDVLPTIADVIGLDLSTDVEGRSLLGPVPVDGPDQRRVYDWGFNTLVPNAEGYALVDGTYWFREMLDQPAPGEGDDAALRFFRFGRHGELVGERVDDLPQGPALDLDTDLDEPQHYEGVPPGAIPVYVAGDVGTGERLDVAVAVNGRIGGWAELQPTDDPDTGHYWVVVPPAFLQAEDNRIELYAIDGDGDDVRLDPLNAPA
jgi:Sulfatase